jgi:hypothetical protein
VMAGVEAWLAARAAEAELAAAAAEAAVSEAVITEPGQGEGETR